MNLRSCDKCGRVYDMDYVETIPIWKEGKSDKEVEFPELNPELIYDCENPGYTQTWKCECGYFMPTGRKLYP